MPALFLLFRAPPSGRLLDADWLALMTVVAAGMLVVWRSVSRVGGLLLFGLYAVFPAPRLVVAC